MTESRLDTRKRVREFMEGQTSKGGRAFVICIQTLIVLSLVAFSVETLPDLSARARKLLRWFEAVSVAVFTLEYLARLIVADRRLRFVFSFYGLIDIVAILPFYLASGIDLRSLRVFRLFRLVRVLKLFRYSKAIHRFKRAFLMIKEELFSAGGPHRGTVQVGPFGERFLQPSHGFAGSSVGMTA